MSGYGIQKKGTSPIIKGPHGFGPKPFLNKPGQAQGTHGGKFNKGGRVGLNKGNDVPHGLKEVKRKKWYEPGIGINVATGQRKKPDLGGGLPADIKAKTDKPGFSGGYTWNPDYRPKGERLEQVADKGVYVHEAPTKDRKQDKTWKTRQKEKNQI